MRSQQQGMYLALGSPETELVASLHAPGQLGQMFEFDVGTPAEPNVVLYQLVKGKAAITFAAGEVVYWDDLDDKTVTNVQGAKCAGVCPVGITPLAGYYFCIVKRGLREIKFVDSPTVATDTAGKVAIVHATAGRADCVTVATMAEVIGRTFGAQDATSKRALCFVDVLGGL